MIVIIMVNSDRCNESCNTLYYSPCRIFVPNNKEDVYLNVLNMIKIINETKKLTKHILWDCKFNGKKYNSDQKWDGSVKIQYNIQYVKKIMFGILVHVFARLINI